MPDFETQANHGLPDLFLEHNLIKLAGVALPYFTFSIVKSFSVKSLVNLFNFFVKEIYNKTIVPVGRPTQIWTVIIKMTLSFYADPN